MSESAIVICAAPGTVHTATLHLPMSLNELATKANDAKAADASIIHLSAGNPETGLAGIQAETVSQFLHIIQCAR